MKKLKFIPLFIAIMLLFVGCSSPSASASNKGSASGGAQLAAVDNSVTVWSTLATEKVRQDNPNGDYLRNGAEIFATTAKGEYEGYQLMLSSSSNSVWGIDLVTADLTLQSNPSVKFYKEQIEVFFEKYLYLTRTWEGSESIFVANGRYPDALPPLSSVIEKGENVMDANKNQGLYVRFNVPQNQHAGTYSGTFKLKFNGGEMDIPVSLTVVDLVISNETHSRSQFAADWHIRYGELDSSQEMYEKYVNAGFEYRVSPTVSVPDVNYDDAGLDYYIDRAVEMMKNPRCTTMEIPTRKLYLENVPIVDRNGNKITVYNVNGGTMSGNPVTLSAVGIDEALLENFLNKMIDRAFQDQATTGSQYIKKLCTHLVDEPGWKVDGLGDVDAFYECIVSNQTFRRTLWRVADALRATSRGQTAFGEQIAQDIENIAYYSTVEYDSRYVPAVDYWCPLVSWYDGRVSNYDSQREKWWYTCISPRAPHPTYHIDDRLYSARVMSWMQAEFNVVGNLYWATTVYANYTQDGVYEMIDDFYTGNGERFYQCNGDGYLFYPGKPYGVDGPIGSIRLEAIRDGLEEYEIFYQLKQEYWARGEDPSSVIRNLCAP